MTPTTEPGPDIAAARELVDLTLQGAEANARPDLIRRLTLARDALAAPASSIPTESVRSAAKTALHALDSLEVDLRTRRATLADPGLAARLHAERDRARQLLDQFRTRTSTWGQVLGEGFATVHSDLDYRLLTGIRTVLAEADDEITTGGRSDDEFDRWLVERLAAEATAVERVLHDGARAVATRLAEHLQLPGALPVPAPSATAGARLVADLPRRPQITPPQRRGAMRLLTVVMPTYGGIVMGLILPRFLGLALPGWLSAVCAVLGALTMGGAAVVVERQQQREQRRNERRSTVRTIGDDCHLALGKQARDRLRARQQDLREATAAAINEHDQLLGRRYQAACAAAEAADHADTAMAEIAADLDWIRQLRAQARGLLLPPPRQERQPAGTRLLNVVS